MYHVLLHCRSIPNLKTILTISQSYYIVELFSFLLHCWGIFCFIKLLIFSHFYYFTEVYSVSLHCWVTPDLSILSSYARSYYSGVSIWETLSVAHQNWVLRYPIAPENPRLRCRFVSSNASYSVSEYIAELFPILLHFLSIPSPNTLLRFTLLFCIAEQFQFSKHCWAIASLLRCSRTR